VLKTTGSGWEGYLRDEYTSLAETDDRIMATEITARWSYRDADIDFTAAWHDIRRIVLEAFGDHYSPSLQFTLHRMGEAVLEARPEVERIRFSLPNKHHLLYDLSRFGLENDHEIFHATDEPYGLIEGTVERASAEIRAGENGGSAVSAPVRP
jgi:urate oxidase